MANFGEIESRLLEERVVPVIAIDDAAKAVPLADALLAGGLCAVEITFRTAEGAASIAAIAKARPQMLVGAGTVLSQENLEAAIAAGARFGVAPGLNPRIVGAAQAKGFPFIPGVATPSEVERGLEFGLCLLKFFPAAAMGGVKYLSAIYAPYRHTGVKFMATGGISEANLPEWLRCPAIGAIGGSWIATKDDIAESRWDAIAAKCAEAAKIASAL